MKPLAPVTSIRMTVQARPSQPRRPPPRPGGALGPRHRGAGIVGLASPRAVLGRRPGRRVTVVEPAARSASGRPATTPVSSMPASSTARVAEGAALRRGRGAALRVLRRAQDCRRALRQGHCRAPRRRARAAGELERAARPTASRACACWAPTRSRRSSRTRGIAGLHSPSTAIVDFVAVSRAIAASSRRRGRAHVRCGGDRIARENGASPPVRAHDGTVLRADRVLVGAGCHASGLAVAAGAPAVIRGSFPSAGSTEPTPTRAHLVHGLIYPVPDPTCPFLGVHLTLTVDSSVLVGPNAVLGWLGEGYVGARGTCATWATRCEWPGMWRLAWRTGVPHDADRDRSLGQPSGLRRGRRVRYVPELRAADVDARRGGRARAGGGSRRRAGRRLRLSETGATLYVRNAPSPAATSRWPSAGS